MFCCTNWRALLDKANSQATLSSGCGSESGASSHRCLSYCSSSSSVCRGGKTRARTRFKSESPERSPDHLRMSASGTHQCNPLSQSAKWSLRSSPGLLRSAINVARNMPCCPKAGPPRSRTSEPSMALVCSEPSASKQAELAFADQLRPAEKDRQRPTCDSKEMPAVEAARAGP